MSAFVSRPLNQPERFGRLWWLPDNGVGNGLSDQAWVPIADVGEVLVHPLLAELRAAGVPAYAAPGTDRPGPANAPEPAYHVWVGTSRYGCAEETLRLRLPDLVRQYQPGQYQPGQYQPVRARRPGRRRGRRRTRTEGRG